MIDYEKKVQQIIDSIITFSFEFDFEAVKNEMKLQEVSMEEIEKLGKEKVNEMFNSSILIIKLTNGTLIDANFIAEHCIENNIKEPVIFINPNFKYVQWIVKKDFTTIQIKRHIKNQLTNNTDLNLTEVQKALVIADTRNKKAEGYIGKIPIKTSNIISKGKFNIQTYHTPESAIKMIHEEIEEIKKENINFVTSKIKRDYKNISMYVIFVIFVTFIWLLNKQYHTLPIWLSNIFSLFLFLIPLVFMRLINHSFFDALFFRKKTEIKYEKEFSNKTT
jgi:hypothetical protein